jgi:integrase
LAGQVRRHAGGFKPITQVSTNAWYGALERAEVSNFRWHDLRHTWASWHVQSGTPLFALQELGGCESAEMVRRYAHLAADHLAPFAERLGALRAIEDEIVGTKNHRPEKQMGSHRCKPP